MSDATDAAYARRAATSADASARDEWFIREVVANVNLTMSQRMLITTNYFRDRIVRNISIPVVKEQGRRGTIVTQRSKPGEFPRADTTLLMKTINQGVDKLSDNIIDGWVGTPLDYGVRLELSQKLNRSYFRRTFHEELRKMARMLTGTISGIN
jgi:hypothetical protein